MAASRWVLLLLGAMATLAAADYAMEGEHYMLSCSSDQAVIYWMLNSGGKAYETGNTYVDEKITVDTNGTIHFSEVRTEYDGVHLCVTQTDEVVGHSVQMKVRPKPSEDLWNDVYKGQFITGLISAIVCAILFTAGCLVFRYRYREPKQVLLNSSEDGGHVNPALEEDGDRFSTKM